MLSAHLRALSCACRFAWGWITVFLSTFIQWHSFHTEVKWNRNKTTTTLLCCCYRISPSTFYVFSSVSRIDSLWLFLRVSINEICDLSTSELIIWRTKGKRKERTACLGNTRKKGRKNDYFRCIASFEFRSAHPPLVPCVNHLCLVCIYKSFSRVLHFFRRRFFLLFILLDVCPVFFSS